MKKNKTKYKMKREQTDTNRYIDRERYLYIKKNTCEMISDDFITLNGRKIPTKLMEESKSIK